MIPWLLSLDWPTVLVGAETVLAAVLVAFDVRETLGYQRRWARAAADDPRYWFIHPVRRTGAVITAIGVYLIVLSALAVLGIMLVRDFPWIRPLNGLLLLVLLAIPWLIGRALRAHVAPTEDDAQ